ncbi:unnamed protein product [Cylicocyclus nassatus]|uniref:Uncharacterized protein n=1 Tax=Cylicocyclus nassatus TaxID=53992 RepID=A0AA36GEZ9_CYLNA|nr:unnamed protein product [Cylicocyclus nassatus]
MMFIFKLFLIALLACFLEGKREIVQSKKKDVGKDVSQQLLGNLRTSEDGSAVKSVKEVKSEGDDFRRDFLKRVFGNLHSSDGVSFEKNTPLVTCLTECINGQQKTHEGKNGEKDSETSVSSDNKTAEQGEGKQVLNTQ